MNISLPVRLPARPNDRLITGLSAASLTLNVLTFIILAITVRPSDIPVPTHYSTINGFDRLGEWYFPYGIALFGLLITTVNTMFAWRAALHNRVIALFVVVGAVIVSAFCLVIARAFGGVLS